MQRQARAFLLEALNVLLNNASWQAELGDAPGHHPTGAIGHLVDVNGKTRRTQVVGRAQAGRSRAHDSHCLAAANGDWLSNMLCTQLLHNETLEVANLQGPIATLATTGRLTGRIADTATNGAEWVASRDRLEGLRVLFLPDVGDIRRCISANRAGNLARRRHIMPIAGVVFEDRRHCRHPDTL